MVGSCEIAVVPEWITRGEVDVSLRANRHTVKTLMHVSKRNAPYQTLCLETFTLLDTVFDEIQGTDRQEVEIIATNGNIIDPGVIGKSIQLLARLVAPLLVRLVHEQGLTAPHKQPTGRIELKSQKGLSWIRIDVYDFQAFINGCVVAFRFGRETAKGRCQ